MFSDSAQSMKIMHNIADVVQYLFTFRLTDHTFTTWLLFASVFSNIGNKRQALEGGE